MDSFNYEIHEYKAGFARTPISSIREVPLTIRLNGREVVTLMCTAKYPDYLAVGFLKSDAFLSHPDQITDLAVHEKKNRILVEVETCHDPWKNRIMERSITSGCGKGTNFGRNVTTVSRRRLTGSIRVMPEQILARAADLHRQSTLYNVTRGCHNASLCSPDEILLFREDIGRHNAIDMLCGQCFLDDISVEDKMIVTTGRVASEILLKTIRIGVPIMVSTAVATSFSVELARKTGITLIGNVKKDSFWVYNDCGRIIGF